MMIGFVSVMVDLDSNCLRMPGYMRCSEKRMWIRELELVVGIGLFCIGVI